MKPVSGYHVASEHTSVLLFSTTLLLLLLYQSCVPFSPSPFYKHSITIPFNRNEQEWRAPDDNNINRISSARKSMGTSRTSFRKEHMFLCSVRIISRALEFRLVLSKATLKSQIIFLIARYMKNKRQ